MIAPIFIDPTLQKQFETAGYVQLELMPQEDVAHLRACYAQYFPDSPAAFHSSSYLADYQQKKEISDAIVSILAPRLAAIFQNYTVFGSAFLTKNVGNHGQMPMHQDWTIVDEREAVAVNIWTPLQDTNAQNGSLQVLEGSHAFLPVLRAPTLPFFYEPYQAEIRAHLHLLDVKAGEAVILNQALIHASPPNLSDQVRLAITTGLKTAGAPMRFHYAAEPGKLEVFAMDDDFLLRFEDFHQDIYARPQFGESLGLIDFVQENPGSDFILDKIRNANGKPSQRDCDVPPQAMAQTQKSFWKRLFGA